MWITLLSRYSIRMELSGNFNLCVYLFMAYNLYIIYNSYAMD